MRKILSNCPVSCFADEISVSLDRQIQVLNELGIKFVEFRSADGTGVADFTDEQAKEAKIDELTTLEEKTGYIIKDSPTQNAGYEESGSGQKEPHEYPALSLAKTKQVEELQQWAGAYPIWLSWKLDGLTLVLTYDNGNLVKILTRGNGNLGTNITFLKGAIGGFPQKISYQGHLVVRGEAAISYTDFAQINDMIEDDDEKYANPRNLASGTLNLEDPAEVKARHVRFHAFTLVHLDEPMVSWGERMHFLEELGFDVVDREATTAQKLPSDRRRPRHCCAL